MMKAADHSLVMFCWIWRFHLVISLQEAKELGHLLDQKKDLKSKGNFQIRKIVSTSWMKEKLLEVLYKDQYLKINFVTDWNHILIWLYIFYLSLTRICSSHLFLDNTNFIFFSSYLILKLMKLLLIFIFCPIQWIETVEKFLILPVFQMNLT